MSNLPRRPHPLRWPLWLHQARAARLSHWLFPPHHQHASEYLQSEKVDIIADEQTCARVLLPPDERAGALKRFRRPKLEMLQRQAASKAVLAACKKQTTCPYCFSPNGIVKKSGTLKISHEPFRSNKNAEAKQDFYAGFKSVVAEQSTVGQYLTKSVEDLNPLKVLELFRRVTAEDCELLSLHPDIGRPEDYLWTFISVPPPCIRPSVASEAGNNEDDLTAKLVEIVNQNRMLLSVMEKGQGLSTTITNWDTLSQMVALYINSQTPGINTTGTKPIRGFVQRLKGKQGRFRGNLSGKRVDFSGRTVIGPDPNLRIDEVAVPEKIAVKLSYPERVTDYNIHEMRRRVTNGAKIHPGANIIETGRGPYPRRSLQPIKDIRRREEMARNLRIGDIVHRHVQDGE